MMLTNSIRIDSYRLRATLGRRWSSYLAIVLLVGLVGGIAMGSFAAARRTQSAFATFLASTNPSDLTATIFPQSPASEGGTVASSERLLRTMAALPDVRHVESWIEPIGVPLDASGAPRLNTLTDLTVVSSVNGLGFNQDRAAVIAGHMADPTRADQFVTTAAGAQAAGWHIGQRVAFGFYSAKQIQQSDFPAGGVRPVVSIDATLVGLVMLSDGIVQDQVDRFPTFALLTPAATTRLLHSVTSVESTDYGYQLVDASRTVPAVERSIEQVVPRDSDVQPHVTAESAARTNRAVRPESIALGVFGLIAALAALAIAGQAMARQFRASQGDLEVLRALGAGPDTIMGDNLLGSLAAVVLGALLAAGVAVALSPIAPIGPVRPVYPGRGVAFDWTVLGAGVALLIGLLGGLAVLLSYRSVPHRVAGRRRLDAGRGHLIATTAARAGFPVPVVAGVRFALEPGAEASATPVRSAFVGTALAVVVVAATLTFGSGLRTLVSHPSLYGWNWTYALASETGPDVPPQATFVLSHDRDVAAWSPAQIADAQIDGQTVPVIFEPAHAAVAPPILTGHAVEHNDEIVLGASTITELGAHVGGAVTVSYGSPKNAPFYVPPTVLHVVGTATMPAIGFPSTEGDHTSMGTGALLSTGVIPAAIQRASESSDRTLDGPEFVFVRMRTGLSLAEARHAIAHVLTVGNRAFATAPNGDGAGATVLSFSNLLPAEIVNYRSMGATPTLLAGSLALGAVVALALTLAASVRRRRGDLALLKALGFTGTQISTSVLVQATVVGLVGLLIGLPLGIALGRWLWVEFAHQIYAVAAPTVPAPSMVLVGVAALLLVNLVAVAPGRIAARTPAALVLRAE